MGAGGEGEGALQGLALELALGLLEEEAGQVAGAGHVPETAPAPLGQLAQEALVGVLAQRDGAGEDLALLPLGGGREHGWDGVGDLAVGHDQDALVLDGEGLEGLHGLGVGPAELGAAPGLRGQQQALGGLAPLGGHAARAEDPAVAAGEGDHAHVVLLAGRADELERPRHRQAQLVGLEHAARDVEHQHQPHPAVLLQGLERDGLGERAALPAPEEQPPGRGGPQQAPALAQEALQGVDLGLAEVAGAQPEGHHVGLDGQRDPAAPLDREALGLEVARQRLVAQHPHPHLVGGAHLHLRAVAAQRALDPRPHGGGALEGEAVAEALPPGLHPHLPLLPPGRALHHQPGLGVGGGLQQHPHLHGLALHGVGRGEQAQRELGARRGPEGVDRGSHGQHLALRQAVGEHHHAVGAELLGLEQRPVEVGALAQVPAAGGGRGDGLGPLGEGQVAHVRQPREAAHSLRDPLARRGALVEQHHRAHRLQGQAGARESQQQNGDHRSTEPEHPSIIRGEGRAKCGRDRIGSGQGRAAGPPKVLTAPLNENPALQRAGSCLGGRGGSRTLVRRPLRQASTCVVGV